MSKVISIWDALDPGFQRILKWICLAAILMFAAWFIIGCASAPQAVNTAATQRETDQAVRELHSFPSAGSSLTPEDQATIDHVRGAVVACGADLKRATDSANKCAADYASLKSDLDKMSNERDEWKQKYKDVAGLWARIKGFFAQLHFLFIFGLVCIGIGVAGTLFWPRPWSWIIKAALAAAKR